jgi:catechol 2,3-dioxygenase
VLKRRKTKIFNFPTLKHYNFTTKKMNDYKIPAQTRIGHVHLKVSDLQKSLDFYCGLLGFDKMMLYGDQAAFISAGGYHHHIGLNTWHSKGAPPAPEYAPGLYHTAILYPERKDLAIILQRLIDAKYPLTGASDHGVSEAIYLNDPDQNGVELYWDKPKDQWPLDENGDLTMFTRRLDVEALLSLAKRQNNK